MNWLLSLLFPVRPPRFKEEERETLFNLINQADQPHKLDNQRVLERWEHGVVSGPAPIVGCSFTGRRHQCLAPQGDEETVMTGSNYVGHRYR